MVLSRGWCGTLKMALPYFEEGDAIPSRGWYGTLKRVLPYFEYGGMILVASYTILKNLEYSSEYILCASKCLCLGLIMFKFIYVCSVL